MISRCFRFFLFLPLLLLVTVPALARQTPEAVLKEIQAAIDASDLAAFERRVDVDALLDQSSSALWRRCRKAVRAGLWVLRWLWVFRRKSRIRCLNG